MGIGRKGGRKGRKEEMEGGGKPEAILAARSVFDVTRFRNP